MTLLLQHISFLQHNLQQPADGWESLWWWKELNPDLEVSGFRGDSGAEACPVELGETGRTPGPMSVVGSL